MSDSIADKIRRLQAIKENIRYGLKNNLREEVEGLTFEQMGQTVRDAQIGLTLEEERELKRKWIEELQSKREDLDLGLHEDMEWIEIIQVMDRIGNISKRYKCGIGFIAKRLHFDNPQPSDISKPVLTMLGLFNINTNVSISSPINLELLEKYQNIKVSDKNTYEIVFETEGA